MNRLLALALLATATATSTAPVFAQARVGVAIDIRQPGVYGRIQIGDVPPPVMIAQPVIIAPPPVMVPRRPIYLYVPPGHQRDWRRYCGRYNACGQPVYFVQEQWVRDRYQQAHPQWRGPGERGRGHDKDRGEGPGRGRAGNGGDKGHDR